MIADNDPIKEIATVVGVVANDNTLSVKLDESGKACIDYKAKKVTISDRCIPKCYRVHPALVRYFRLALAMHEAQHWAFMKDMVDDFTQWIESRKYPELGIMAVNIVDDYRGNTWLEETYAYDIGQRITWMNKAMLKAWKPHIAKMLRKAIKDDDKNFLENPVNFVVHGGIQCGILSVPTDEFANEWAMWTGAYPPDEAVAAVEKICEATWESKYKCRETIFESYQEVYRLMEMFTRQKWKQKKTANGDTIIEVTNVPGGSPQQGGTPVIDMGKIPVNYGGGAEVEGQKDAALKELEKLKGEEDSSGDEYQAHAGKGAGTEAPTPVPNEGVYQQLVMRNMPYIVSLLNKLKTLMQPRLDNLKYQKSGRLMTKMLGKYATSRRPVENIYQRKRFVLEKQKVALSLVVDLSGSMNTEDARNVLTIIAEVGGQWLSDSDTAIFVFGSEYQKIKAFGEQYRNTRARIGGVHNLGGTMLAECLQTVHRMYRAQGNGRQKVCVIVSDFCLGDVEPTRKEMALMEKDDITFIGVGMCASDLNHVKSYTKENSTFINHVSELPGLFYDIYRRAAT